jgi:hypothetical protein
MGSIPISLCQTPLDADATRNEDLRETVPGFLALIFPRGVWNLFASHGQALSELFNRLISSLSSLSRATRWQPL